MDAIQIIYFKLNLFYKKFYINKLIKGLVLFSAIGLLYYIFTALVENILWFNSLGRAILFYLFLAVEIFLGATFLIWPIFKLLKVSNGISYEDSAQILENHFPNEVGDKLKNLLQLNQFSQNQNSDLLAASIDQKTKELEPIPFLNAITFKSNVKYLPLLLLPVVIVAIFYLAGKHQNLFNGFKRVANYSEVYQKPAPFKFEILDKNLKVTEQEDFVLEFKTVGEIIPDRVSIHFNKETYYAEKTKPGYFKFTFHSVGTTIPFYLEANSYTSNTYYLSVLPVPSILDFNVTVKIPSHLSSINPIQSNTGNLIIPEGSVVTWKISAQNTHEVLFVSDSIYTNFTTENTDFKLVKKIKEVTDYQIITKNTTHNFSQNVDYRIDVIKDEYPSLEVHQIPDSIAQGKKIYNVKVADDYGISKFRVVYYDVKNPSKLYTYAFPIQGKTTTKYIYQFPQGLNLQENTTYSYYFEAVDNDAINNFKATQSTIFLHNELNQIQKQDENLSNQMQQINALEKSLSQTKSADKQSNEVNQMLKQSSNIDYKDLKKLQDFFNLEIENAKNIDEAAKKLADKLKEKSNTTDQEKAKELEKRLDNLQKEQEKNKKLYEELQKYTDKLTKEQLLQKMQQAKQNATQQKRSLEQLVEQTKRFYVEQKVEQIVSKLSELAKKQEQLTTIPDNVVSKQQQLNQAFDEIKKNLQELNQENSGLKKPMDLPKMDADAEDTKQEMNKAAEQLKQNKNAGAQKNQKQAAKKMKEMAEKIESGIQKDESDQLQEDAKALRQILKNLLKFSFTQESTMKAFKTNGSQSFHFNKLLKEEQKLKNQFKFIDDSLYTLAIRQIRIQDVVNKSVGEIHYNIDQSLHQLVENNLSKGISHQQYVINHANVLADLLSDALSNMQSEMQMQQGSGKGKPSPGQGEPQLSDIIQKQKGLEQKFGEGLDQKNGNEGGKTEPKSGNQPLGQQPANKSGNSGKEGQDGDEDESGELLEIYKEQQRLREAIEKTLGSKPGNTGLEKTLAEMKKIEQNLLQKGFSNEVLNQFKNLNHELLKLQDALKEQGQDNKRQGNSNTENYKSNDIQIPKSVLDYIQGTEILQKNTLPLQPKYDNLVKEYFK